MRKLKYVAVLAFAIVDTVGLQMRPARADQCEQYFKWGFFDEDTDESNNQRYRTCQLYCSIFKTAESKDKSITCAHPIEELTDARSSKRALSILGTHNYNRSGTLDYMQALNHDFVIIQSFAVMLEKYKDLRKRLADYNKLLDDCLNF